MKLPRTILFVLLVLAGLSGALAQAKKAIVKKSLPLAQITQCASGTFTFKCPKGYKVLLSGKTDDRLFFANSKKDKLGVFVVFEPTTNSLSEALPKIIDVFLSKGSRDFEWRDVDANPLKSSKYEIESKRRIGINNPISAYVMLEYRLIEFNGKKLLTGALADGYLGPIGIRESFEDGVYPGNMACFDSVSIIAALTKEKLDLDNGPCVISITISPGP